MPGPESILYPEFAIPPKKKISRVSRAPHASHSGACKVGKEVEQDMKRIIKVLVLSALMVMFMATSNVSVASACPWWADKCDGDYGKRECHDKDRTGGSTKDNNCGW